LGVLVDVGHDVTSRVFRFGRGQTATSVSARRYRKLVTAARSLPYVGDEPKEFQS